MAQATINIISATDDLRTVIKKVNDNFRALNQNTHIVGINSGGGSSQFHNGLLGRGETNCHPMEAIAGLVAQLSLINAAFNKINDSITEIEQNIVDINETLDDHEERIEALERA